MAAIDRRGSLASEVGLAIKAPCVVATTANIVLSGVQTIDGVTVGNGAERVLVKNQTDQTTNGIYVANTGTWTLAPDARGNTDWANGSLIYIASGVLNATKTYTQTSTDNPVIIGTSLIAFSQVIPGTGAANIWAAPQTISPAANS